MTKTLVQQGKMLDVAAGATNTLRPLTHSLEASKEGLAVDATHEEWRPVVGYEGYYEVSSRGAVRSVERDIAQAGYIRHLKSRTLRPACTGPYLHVYLMRDGKSWTVRIHRLVASAFLGPAPVGKGFVCHNDGNPTNNHVGNLRWDSASANQVDRVRHGTHNKAAATHCKRGHEFTAENTVRIRQLRNGRVSNQRQCRTCTRLRERGGRA